MSPDAISERTLLVTVDSLRYDHYAQMNQTREFLGESHPRAFATSNATMYSFQSIIGGQYPSQPGIAEGTSFVPDVHSTGTATFGYQSNPLLSEKYGYSDGFDVYDDIERSRGLKGRLEKVLTEGTLPYRFASFTYNQFQRVAAKVGESPERNYPSAQGLIESAMTDVENVGDPAETEWFVWVHLMEPHHPYNPSSEFTDTSRVEAQVLSRKVLAGTATPEEESHVQDLYRQEVTETDAELARLWNWVPEDTRIVFCADHGELLGEEALGWGHFARFTPEILHIPFATRNAPELTGEVVSLIDVPSILLGSEYGEGSLSRDIAFAANGGKTAAIDGTTIVTDDATYPLGDSADDESVARLSRERSRFEARLDRLDYEEVVDMDDLRDLGYA